MSKNEKLDSLKTMLTTVENNLLRSRLEATRGEVEHAYEFINQAAEDGVIDIECGNCDQEVGDADFENVE